MRFCSVCGFIANEARGKLKKCKSCETVVHEKDCHVGSGDNSCNSPWQCSVCCAKSNNKSLTGCCFCPYDGSKIYKLRLKKEEMGNDTTGWIHVCCMFFNYEQAANHIVEHECYYCGETNMLQVVLDPKQPNITAHVSCAIAEGGYCLDWEKENTKVIQKSSMEGPSSYGPNQQGYKKLSFQSKKRPLSSLERVSSSKASSSSSITSSLSILKPKSILSPSKLTLPPSIPEISKETHNNNIGVNVTIKISVGTAFPNQFILNVNHIHAKTQNSNKNNNMNSKSKSDAPEMSPAYTVPTHISFQRCFTKSVYREDQKNRYEELKKSICNSHQQIYCSVSNAHKKQKTNVDTYNNDNSSNSVKDALQIFFQENYKDLDNIDDNLEGFFAMLPTSNVNSTSTDVLLTNTFAILIPRSARILKNNVIQNMLQNNIESQYVIFVNNIKTQP